MFLPAVGLNHASGGGKGHGYGCKAGFYRQSNDTGHRCDESASIPQKVFFLFFSYFSARYLPLGLRRFPIGGTTELRKHAFTRLWIMNNFFLFLPAVGLNHVVVVARGMAMAVKLALTDRAMTLDTDAMKAHQSHSRYFFCFCLIFREINQ